MRTVELFCGTKSFSNVAEKNGAKTWTTDIDRTFDPTIAVSILDLDSVPTADILWASPPCETFSVAAIGQNWAPGYEPKHDRTRTGIALVKKTLALIDESAPTYWFIENPRGMLRKMPWLIEWVEQHGGTRHTISYCQYGDTRMKPTDIWTNAYWWTPRPMCKRGAPCHEAAPRGSSTGTQGIKGYAERSRIPPELFEEIFAAYKKHIELPLAA